MTDATPPGARPETRFVIIAALALAGCYQSLSADDVAKAIDRCKTNGGLDYLSIDGSYYRSRCLDGMTDIWRSKSHD